MNRELPLPRSPLPLIGQLLAVILCLFSSSALLAEVSPVAIKGQLDLQEWDSKSDLQPLTGEWQFIWSEFVSPDELGEDVSDRHFNMPSTWDSNGKAGYAYPGVGYASFLLTVSGLPKGVEFAVIIPEIATAYRLFANGDLVSEGGKVASSVAGFRPYQGNRWARLPASDQGRIHLTLHVANYSAASGGPWQPLSIGSLNNVVASHYSGLMNEGVIVALMMLIALMLLMDFSVNRREKAGLWLGLLILVMGIRLSVISHAPVYWWLGEQLSWAAHMKVNYVSMMVATLCFIGWIIHQFPDDFPERAFKYLASPFLFMAIFCGVTEPITFTAYLGWITSLIMLVVLFGLWGLAVVVYRKRQGANILMIGLGSLGIAVFHDLMMNNQIIRGGYWLPVGYLIFIVSQAGNFLIHRNLQRRQVETLSNELQTTNTQLEKRVESRTRDLLNKAVALKDANQQLQVLANVDSLTGVLNRRAFMERLTSLESWQENVSILLIDIDFFKKVNDNFGHAAGDDVLRAIGLLLQKMERAQDGHGRLGGEEFGVLLVDCNIDGAQSFARRFRNELSKLEFPQWPGLGPVTASIGIAVGSLQQHGGAHLLNEADKMMYQVKRGGRDSFEAIQC